MVQLLSQCQNLPPQSIPILVVFEELIEIGFHSNSDMLVV